MPHWMDLLRVLVGKELQVRYKGSFLGYFWSILHPLAFTGIFYIVFKNIVRLEVENYALVLVTALFPWQWLQNSVNASPSWFLDGAPLLKKVRFPRWTLVLAGSVTDMTHFLFAVPVILAFLLFEGFEPQLGWILWLPVLVLAQLMIAFGISLMLATLNLYLRDLERLTSLLMLIWFYATPVLYPISMVPEQYRPLVADNPAGALIIAWRSLFFEGTVPVGTVAVALAWGVALCGIGSWVYNSLQWRFAEVV